MLDRLSPKRIVLLKPSALGDIAHSLPVLTALRRHYPEADISWVANQGFAPLLEGHPHLNRVIPFDRAAFRSRPVQAIRYAATFAKQLRRHRFDLVIDLQGLLRTGLMAAATGSPVRIGFANAREGSRRFYTHPIEVPDADRLHAVDRYWRIVEALGAGTEPKQFVLPQNEAETAQARQLLAELPGPRLAVIPGAKWLTKRWPIGYFAELANRVHADFGGSVFLLGANEDEQLGDELTAQLHGPYQNFIGRTSLPRLAALLAEAEAVLGNDTGPLHLAAALGRPCVVPYLCTQVRLHGPYQVPGGGVETQVACAGSYLKQCPHGMICMNELVPDRLWPLLSEVLSQCPNRSRAG